MMAPLSAFALPLADVAVKAAVILAVAAALVQLMRRASAASRHVVWVATLAAALLLPVARAALPAMPLLVLPAAPTTTPTPQPTTAATPANMAAAIASEVPGPADAVTVAVESPSVGTVIRRQGVDWTWPGALVTIWLAGVGVLLARAVAGAVGVRRLTRGARRADDARLLARVRQAASRLGLRRPVVVLMAARDLMPATWGVVRPRILVPLSATAWTDQRLDTVLVHELAHVARFDALADALARLAVVLFWFNPLTWFAARQARLEAEMACDDLVLGQGTRPSHYAEDLLFLLQTMSPPVPSSTALATARGSRLASRLRAILDAGVNRRGLSRASVAVGAALVFMMLPMATARLAARPGAPPIPTSRLASQTFPVDVRVAQVPATPAIRRGRGARCCTHVFFSSGTGVRSERSRDSGPDPTESYVHRHLGPS